MPHAVAHVLIVMILLELYREYCSKKSFPLRYVLIGGLAGLLPDLDVAIFYALSFFGFGYFEVHRVFLHTLLIPLILMVLAVFSWNFKSKILGKQNLKLRNIFLVIAFGVTMHILLDSILASIVPLYPLSSYTIGLNLINFVPLVWRDTILPSIDAVLLVLWLIYLEAKHKISSFF
jgi:hypothetical protein